MDKIITKHTYEDIEALYYELLWRNASFEELKRRMADYKSVIPAFIKYLYAKYLYNLQDFSRASQEISGSISSLDSDILTRLFLGNDISKLYGLAGEIYANNDENEESLAAFKNYLSLTSRIKSTDNSSCLLSFRRYNEYSLSDLINDKLTLCSPRVMNDPYDTLFLKWAEYQNNVNKDRKHIKFLCEAFDSYRIRSFSLPKDINGNEMIENILMWSHYAGNHEGFCVKYKLPDSIFVENDKAVIRLRKIIYHENEEENGISRINLEIPTIDTTLGLCRKHPCWEYENEVRLIAYLPNNEKAFYPLSLDFPTIEEIYLGYKCPKEHIKTIRNILDNKKLYKERKIKYYQMKSDYSNIYKLKAQEL